MTPRVWSSTATSWSNPSPTRACNRRVGVLVLRDPDLQGPRTSVSPKPSWAERSHRAGPPGAGNSPPAFVGLSNSTAPATKWFRGLCHLGDPFLSRRATAGSHPAPPSGGLLSRAVSGVGLFWDLDGFGTWTVLELGRCWNLGPRCSVVIGAAVVVEERGPESSAATPPIPRAVTVLRPDKPPGLSDPAANLGSDFPTPPPSRQPTWEAAGGHSQCLAG